MRKDSAYLTHMTLGCFGLLLNLAIGIPTAAAIDQINLSLGNITGAGLTAKDISLDWTLQTNTMQIQVNIAELTLPALPNPLQNVKLSCGTFTQTADTIRCEQGRLNLAGSPLDTGEHKFSLHYNLTTQHAKLNVSQLNFAGGRIQADIHYTPSDWQITAKTRKVDLETVIKRITPFIELLPAEYSLAGQANLTIQAKGQANLPTEVELTGTLQQFSFANPTATQVMEGANLKLTAQARQQNAVWEANGKLTLQAGEVYNEPIYFAVNPIQPVQLQTKLQWDAPILTVQSLRYTHPQVLTIEKQARMRLAPEFALESVSVKMPKTALKPVHTFYLASWLDTLDFGKVAPTGALTLDAQWQPDFQQVIARFHDVDVEDTEKTFGLFGLDGQLNWQVGAFRPRATHLTWQRGYFLSDIQLGNSYLHAVFNDNTVRLLTPLYQPILDGALEIDSFTMHELGQTTMQGTLQGRLSPISMQALSAALGLPPLSGSVAGQIPTVNYAKNTLHVDGSIKVKVFEGDMQIRQLRISHLLGRLPVLTGHLDIDKFNLARVTEVFQEFGAIQGHLSGRLSNLRLLNWQPVSFDGYFGTPEDNTLPRKISQTAVRNLSNIGGNGGVVDAISQHVLGFFENFSYERLGLGCRLENGVCWMSGAAPATGGYYIVKGGSLPRIDVIGYNEQVDWAELLQRIETLSQAQTPVIK